MTAQFSTNLSHQDKIAAARGLARKRLPYFSAALFALMPRPMPGMFERVGAGMGVTPRGIMYYDPRVITEEWDLEDIEFGLLHEVGHFLRNHAQRCEEYGYDPAMWNAAGDAAINDDLIAAGCKCLSTDIVPRKILDPQTQKPMVDGLTEEAYYDALRQMANKGKAPDSGASGSGSGKSGKGVARPGGGACGGVSGNPLAGLEDDGTHSGTTDTGRSNVEIERIKKAVAGDIQKHIEQHGAGNVPGGWLVWANNTLVPPQIRWQDRLRRAVRRSAARVKGMMDYHYERPARRQWAMGYGKFTPILPSMYAPSPRVGAFVDTSGSMGPADLQIAMSEMAGVLKSAGCEVLLGVCDAQMHGKIEAVKDIRTACSRLAGGGGTNFCPVFEELARMPMDKRPHVVIFLTDGDGPAPETPPKGMHVIWVLVGQHAVVPYSTRGNSITWGEQIMVKDASGGTR